MSAAAAAGTEVKVGKRLLKLTNLNKVLYPATGFTKGQVIDYYSRIAPTMLPHLKGRPTTRKRYPNGVDGIFFYEKNVPEHRPDWIKTVNVWSETNNDHTHYVLVDEVPTLVWLANLAALELHTLLAKVPKLQQPTMMVFDLDPGPPADILDCIRIATHLREMFDHLKLKCLCKTSGGKGLHLYVPLNTPGVTFEKTKSFARSIAQLLEQEMPNDVTHNMRKELRKGKIFVDWSQNDDHKTTVCAYSLRAREHPTVSTPVTWEELEAARKARNAKQLVFEAGDVLKRVEKLGDLFEPVRTLKQKLPKL
jgi:bifunctional non-homologous end joining protein LigD